MTSKYTIADFNAAICKPVEDETKHLLDKQDKKIKGLVEFIEYIRDNTNSTNVNRSAQAALEKYRSE